MKVLEKDYYWKQNNQIPYTTDHLERIMIRSIDPTLDGDRAEGQSSALAVALASAGDSKFAETLSTQSLEVKKEVSRYILPLFNYYHLHYPKTQSIVSKYQKGLN